MRTSWAAQKSCSSCSSAGVRSTASSWRSSGPPGAKGSSWERQSVMVTATRRSRRGPAAVLLDQAEGWRWVHVP